ncbi:MAG: SPOR domain-containing protein [Armatimonadota bacterium]|nr:SPOR domain-containing protein [Armatimonadota bacterium]
MQNKHKPIRQKEGEIDRRIIALGVIGFMALAAVFMLGFLIIGPKIGNSPENTSQQVSTPTQEQTPPMRMIEELPRNEEKPAVEVEITEHKEEPQTKAEPETTEQKANEGVKVNGNEITMTLEPKKDDLSTNVEKKTKEKPTSQPAEHSELERPRVATEPKTLAAPQIIYRVQVGKYRNKENADQLASELQEKGYKARIVPTKDGERTFYHVQIGRYNIREDAQELANDLVDEGYSPTVISEPKE